MKVCELGWVSCFLGLLLLANACQQKAAKKPEVSSLDKVAPSPMGTSQAILHKTFTLKSLASFPFEIPAHAVRPHLHGIFESFVGQLRGVSDDTANVDFVIVNEKQYADMTQNRPSEAMLSLDASHNQAVNFDLPPSLDQPIKYYLLFRNSSKTGKVVEADFHVDF